MAKVTMVADAAALLIAKSYRWKCTQCHGLNIEDSVVLVAACEHCHQQYRVNTVFHANGRQRVEPGVGREQIRGVKKFSSDDPDQDTSSLELISLVATAYAWACAECDPWADRPQHVSSCCTQTVSCPMCGARFFVSEARHRVDSDMPHREYLRHAVNFSRDDDDDGGDSEKVDVGAASCCPVYEMDSFLGAV